MTSYLIYLNARAILLHYVDDNGTIPEHVLGFSDVFSAQDVQTFFDLLDDE